MLNCILDNEYWVKETWARNFMIFKNDIQFSLWFETIGLIITNNFKKKGSQIGPAVFDLWTPIHGFRTKEPPYFQTLHLSQSFNLNTLIYRLYMILYTLIIYLLYHLPLLFEIETFFLNGSLWGLWIILHICVKM